MFKKSLFLGISAGFLSGVACIIFSIVYKETMFTDFSPVVSNFNLIGACLFGCILASLGYFGVKKIMTKYGDIVFNLLFTILTFASIISPIAFKFPPELDFDGIDMVTSYFIPFAMTLHFFPIIIWLALKPVFFKS
jgi:hypothetical protein